MNPNHYTSLELSKMLKEEGAPQVSEVCWVQLHYEDEYELKQKYGCDGYKSQKNTYDYDSPIYSAFSVAELGDILRMNLQQLQRTYIREHREQIRQLFKRLQIFPPLELEAEDRGKLYLYLLQNKIIEGVKV